MFDLGAFRTAVSMINGPQNKLYIDVISEAADEIERLRREIADIKANYYLQPIPKVSSGQWPIESKESSDAD